MFTRAYKNFCSIQLPNRSHKTLTIRLSYLHDPNSAQSARLRLCRLPCGKALPFRSPYLLNKAAPVFVISKDSPVHYLTSVTNSRLPVFRTDNLKVVACAALDETRKSAGMLFFAYVIMPDHLHMLIGSPKKPSEVLRYINGITSRRVIDYLKDPHYESSLSKLRRATGEREYKYSLWDYHPNLKLISTENGLIEKANYIHQNPVRAGLVARAEDYRYSSIRFWLRKPLEDEPLLMDLDKLKWHSK
jgi:REP element-mobilizing transposase RayT